MKANIIKNYEKIKYKKQIERAGSTESNRDAGTTTSMSANPRFIRKKTNSEIDPFNPKKQC